MTILGIHTPETAAEKKPARVKAQIKAHKLTFPVALDNRGKTWQAWGNIYWPSIYLIDKQGFVRYYWVGELNGNNAKGQVKMQKKIEELLVEKE